MSTISVRVTLLILATTMFAAIWSNDHKPQPAHPRTVVGYEFTALCPEDVLEPVSLEIVREHASSVVVEEVGLPVEPPAPDLADSDLEPLPAEKPVGIRVSGMDYPLPSDLNAGEYRVIDRFGNVETFSVSDEELISWGITIEPSHRTSYEVCIGEDRWHFIRVERPVAPEPTQKEVADAWKSVFRFAGRRVSPAINKASAPLSRWLGGELNLSGESRKIR